MSLAASEVALERGTYGNFRAQVAPFVNRQRIEYLITTYLPLVQDHLRSPLGGRLM